MTAVQRMCAEHKDEILQFASDLVKIRAETGAEQDAAIAVKAKMEELGFDRILTTKLGDIVGVMGNGPTKILFDSHMDAVVVNDADEWEFPPFGGVMDDTYIHGRGSVDMRCSIACTVYAAYFAKQLGYTDGKTVYVSASVMEEDFDAYAIRKEIEELQLDLDYAVICEPSNDQIALGHRGRAMFEIVTHGISCHGSAPENGKNAVYEMRKVIERVEALNDEFYKIEGEHGSVVLSKIECEAVSLNAVPASCRIYLDRRLAKGETFEVVKKEMDKLVEGLDAQWNVYIAKGTSYTGQPVDMYTFMEAWETDVNDPLPQALAKSYRENLEKEPVFFKWNFSTNGFATTEKGIPTIGLGPGEMQYCHMRDERVKKESLLNCCKAYTGLIANI